MAPDNKLTAFKILQKDIDESKVGLQKNLTNIDVIKIRNMYCEEKSAINV